MEYFTELKPCKYCQGSLEMCQDEGIQCSVCNKYVHVRCLKRGSVPGGLYGDLFFTFICQECSSNSTETFCRNKMSWMQVINLVLYHLQNKSPGLARKGFFHWRNHVGTFIDKNWEVLFSNDVKKKKKWTGTIAGTLSHFGNFGIFLSGTTIFNEQAWWTLNYPKLSPIVVSNIYAMLTVEKQRYKLSNEKKLTSDAELFQETLSKYIPDKDLIQPFNTQILTAVDTPEDANLPLQKTVSASKSFSKKRNMPPTIENQSKKLIKLMQSNVLPDDLTSQFNISENTDKMDTVLHSLKPEESSKGTKLLDPFCHYNTSLNSISRLKSEQLQVKLTGGIRKELILSPYSGIYLKPYIRRDIDTFPKWLQLMAEIQLKVNIKNANYELPPREPIDYTYVQPEHIPGINSLCNQFFWPGIDLTECLQYPDFSCVVMYKRLIIGFAFLVPDVKHVENYVSFVFTRPGWRNCGIATFMIYHLIQTSLGKDITLHVSVNSPALILYQKFGFKVEQFVMNFYDKYYRNDIQESKHAFFCRLERLLLTLIKCIVHERLYLETKPLN